jgi:hypothetical protein
VRETTDQLPAHGNWQRYVPQFVLRRRPRELFNRGGHIKARRCGAARNSFHASLHSEAGTALQDS